MSRLREVESFINDCFDFESECGWIDFNNVKEVLNKYGYDSYEDEPYSLYREDKEVGEGVFALVKFVNEAFELDLEYLLCGEYDSSGYDMEAYAIAGIIDGDLYFDSFTKESY